MNFTDCTVADIERLRPRINQLALDFHRVQEISTAELDIRDQAIVLNASLIMVVRSSTNATKKSFTSRFHRSIEGAMRLTRIFALGRMASNKGPSQSPPPKV